MLPSGLQVHHHYSWQRLPLKVEPLPIILLRLLYCVPEYLSPLKTVGYLEYDTSSIGNNIFLKTDQNKPFGGYVQGQ